MAEFIEPGFLTDDELKYELSIRYMPPVITRSRIILLRERMLMESRKEVESPNSIRVTITDLDLKRCSDNLVVIESLIVLAAENGDERSVLVLKSRLNHLSARLRRYNSDDVRVCNRLEYMIQKTDSYINMLCQSSKDPLGELLKQCHYFPDKCEGGGDRAPTPNISVKPSQGAVPKEFQKLLPIPEDDHYNRASPAITAPRDDAGEDLSDLINSIDLNDTDIAKEISNVDFYENSKPVEVAPSKISNPPYYQARTETYIANKKLQPTMRDRTYTSFPNFGVRHEPIRPRVDVPVNSLTNTYQESRRDRDMPNPPPRLNRYEEMRNNVPVVSYENPNRDRNRLILEPQQQPNYYEQFRQPLMRNDVDYQYERQPGRGYRNPIPSWRLTFDGDGSKVNAFLTQVYHMARADRVSADDLLESAIHLFVGNAREWYMAFSDTFRVWGDLTRALRTEFIPHDSDFFILKQIEQRYQKKNEPFVLYLSSMVNLYNQLAEVPTPDRQIQQIKRNMLPSLARQIAIYDVRNIRDLSRYVKLIEDVDDSYKGRMDVNYKSQPENRFSNQRREVSEIENTNQTQFCKQIPRIPCWNCRENNHDYTQCTFPKMRVFCYECGELGQLATSCIMCRKGNRGIDPANREGRLESNRR